APADTFEQAVKILDHEGFRKEQADALAQGRYLGLGFSAYIEPTGAATGRPAIVLEQASISAGLTSTGAISRDPPARLHRALCENRTRHSRLSAILRNQITRAAMQYRATAQLSMPRRW
ncbi:hypothetical protein, partial [Mycobacterium scrofulaceum]|uniref:hypothetical protein n=1 Tax=Mycobacterium scrofulaceum TaxID=1783 RepID=UPI000A60BCBB